MANIPYPPPPPDKSSADLVNWRQLYSAPPLRQNMLDMQGSSAGVLEAIQNMPYVFDPRKFLGQPGQFSQIGQTQGQIASQVHPTGLPQITPQNIQGLLQMLGPQAGGLLAGLFPGGV